MPPCAVTISSVTPVVPASMAKMQSRTSALMTASWQVDRWRSAELASQALLDERHRVVTRCGGARLNPVAATRDTAARVVALCIRDQVAPVGRGDVCRGRADHPGRPVDG